MYKALTPEERERNRALYTVRWVHTAFDVETLATFYTLEDAQIVQARWRWNYRALSPVIAIWHNEQYVG